MRKKNKYVEFSQRPSGRPDDCTFCMKETERAELKAGEFLIRNNYLSMDPAMVGRMRDEDNYAESVTPGEAMHCYAIGQVIESKNPLKLNLRGFYAVWTRTVISHERYINFN